MNARLASRPRVGNLVVPYMVDESRKPIDFKELDPARVERCARHMRCGVCGGRIKHGRLIAFIGPDDGRTCFADPWMHPECADTAAEQCPFVAGRRDWRDPSARTHQLLVPYAGGLVVFLAEGGHAHRDGLRAWHFQAVGPLSRREAA